MLPYFFLISLCWYSLLSSSSPYFSFLLFTNLDLFFLHFYSFIFPSFLILTKLFVSFIQQSCLTFSSFLLVHIPFFPHHHHIIRFFYLAILPYFFLISTRWYSLLSSSSPYYSFLLFSNLALFFPHFYSLIFPSFLILTILFVSFI